MGGADPGRIQEYSVLALPPAPPTVLEAVRLFSAGFPLSRLVPTADAGATRGADEGPALSTLCASPDPPPSG